MISKPTRKFPALAAARGGWRVAVPWLALVHLVLTSARAAIPDGAKADPLFAQGCLVVYPHYAGVKNDASAPDTTTAGLQAAIDDAYAHNLVLYFPPGVYAINDTLKAYTAAKNTPIASHHLAMVGSTAGAARPVIQAHASSTAFDDPAHPRVMVEFKNFGTDDFSNPQEERPATGFYQMFRGIDLDCGGKPGAIGLYFNQAQDSSIENVKVIATGAHTGIRGLPNRAWGAVNIEVEGGRYGLDTTKMRAGLPSKGNVGSVVAGLRLRHQEIAALVHAEFGLTIVGFEIVTRPGATEPALRTGAGRDDSVHLGALTLIDGSIELAPPYRGGAAIANPGERNLYLRNVWVRGSRDGALVQSGSNPAVAGTGGVLRIDEYSYANQREATSVAKETWTVIDGAASRVPSPPAGLGNGERRKITSGQDAMPADLVTRHTWARLPSIDDADAYNPVAAGKIALDPATGTAQVSARAFQALLDAQRKIFLPKGVYRLDGTVTLRKDTVLFGVARHLTRIEVDTAAWRPTAEVPIITTDDDATATTYLGDLAIGVPSAELAYDWFTAVDWQAGRNSMVHLARPYHWPESTALATNDHSLIKIRNSGGGRWYFPGRGQSRAMQHPGYRILEVSGTAEPLWIYGLNLEHAVCDKFAEFTGASNLRIYEVKTEYNSGAGAAAFRGTLLSFHDCANAAVFGQTALRESPAAGFSTIEFTGSSPAAARGLLASNIVPQSDGKRNPGRLLSESITGLPGAGLSWHGPSGAILALALYKRGELDDAAMTHSDIAYGPLPAGWARRDIGASQRPE